MYSMRALLETRLRLLCLVQKQQEISLKQTSSVSPKGMTGYVGDCYLPERVLFLTLFFQLNQMCLHLPLSQKKQPAKGLPPGWTFIFSKNTTYKSKTGRAYVPGLFIYHPECDMTFRSVEAAVVYSPKLRISNPNVVAEFYTHTGVSALSSNPSLKRKKSPRTTLPAGAPKEGSTSLQMNVSSKSRGSPMTLEELFNSRCGTCVNCSKVDCGQCSTCVSTGSMPRRQVCIQKVSRSNGGDRVVHGSLQAHFSLLPVRKRCAAMCHWNKRPSPCRSRPGSRRDGSTSLIPQGNLTRSMLD